ncbi:MAG: hypothetical protein HY049_15540 [Acidobacteria bacterium]|nr:hypothetical protein [Acidobacteriota bacterium]
MTTMPGSGEREATRREIERLHAEARRLERELEGAPASAWPPQGYYTPYHVVIGILLGCVGAGSSLLFNVVGSLLVGQHPLQLIRVYLTFPLGETALTLDSGVALGVGICLYLGTGCLYGAAFHLVMSRWFERAPASRRFAVATAVGLGLWIVNFYGILSWLQPLLFDGNWIVTLVPFWVAGLTHLVFAWTMLVIAPWGVFEPYPG